APAGAGALSGKTVYVSAGHGWVWGDTLGRWATQRPNTNGLGEDFISAETGAQELIPDLRAMGAYVGPGREGSMQARLGMAEGAEPGFAVAGAAPVAAIPDGWARGPDPIPDASSPFAGGGSRTIATDPAGGTTATWTLDVPVDGDYEVYLAWVAGADRAP